MNLLKGILDKIIQSNPKLKVGVQEAKILELWPEAAGTAISKHTKAVFMKQKTVFIEVDHPVWKQELFTNKAIAIKKYNQCVTQAMGTNPEGSWVLDLFLISPGYNPNPSHSNSSSQNSSKVKSEPSKKESRK